MTVIAAVAIEADEFALGRVFSDADRRVELARLVPLGEAFAPYFWIDNFGDPARFESRVETDPRVARVLRLNGTVDRLPYRIEWTPEANTDADGFLAALRAHDLLVERAITQTGDEWLFRLRVHDREALSAFQRTCFDAAIPIDVRRAMHNPNAHDESLGLTAKQHEALVLAFDEGYFRVPSEITLTGLSEKLDLSRQAYTRRLQRALRNYLTHTGIEELTR